MEVVWGLSQDSKETKLGAIPYDKVDDSALTANARNTQRCRNLCGLGQKEGKLHKGREV